MSKRILVQTSTYYLPPNTHTISLGLSSPNYLFPMKQTFLLLILLFLAPFLHAQDNLATQWADSITDQLTLKEKVAQLMVVRVPLNMTKKSQRKFEKLIKHNKVGGVCFFAGTAKQQLEQTKHFQGISRVPLMVCLDAEWGLGMRLKDCYSFPHQMLMGALDAQYDTLIYMMGQEIGIQCRNLGVNVNFAPVVDLNSNPDNPVIGVRSFGSNREKASRKGIMYFRGLQSQHVLATAKHFPGHGDTDVDSHLDLPVIYHSKAYIDTIDSYPFRRLTQNGIRGMMVAHLQVNALDDTPNMPSTLSPKIMNYLKTDCGFDGVVFTDGMDMKGMTKNYSGGTAELMSLCAGADIMLLPPDVEAAISKVVDSAEKSPAFAQVIDAKCRKVLREKYWCGLNELDLDKLHVPTKDDNARCEKIAYEMARHALTLVRNNVGDSVLVIDKSPYKLAAWPKNDTTGPDKIIMAYDNHPAVREAVRNALSLENNSFSGITTSSSVASSNQGLRLANYGGKASRFAMSTFEGSLPVTVADYEEGYRWMFPVPAYNPYKRLAPAGMDSIYFVQIDSVAMNGIKAHAYPGCQILVVKDGDVVYNRSYGTLTYDADSPLVDTNTVYDLASLTKVTATTFAIMKLVDAGKIGLDDRMSRYLPYLKHTDKKKITIREALSHFGRLIAFDSYWENVWCESKDSIIMQIVNSKLGPRHKYVYSDVGFILLGDLVEYVSGQSLDIFMQQQFYGPMGMTSTTFNPLDHGIDVNRIAPTENNPDKRMWTLRGVVHDPNAAAMGGVAGNAGLFSTAEDLSKLYIMLLNGGEYNGRRYLSQEVINTFNQQYYIRYGNRRALGYDKPLNPPHGNTAPEVSQSSYGHTGFTGTMVWADPEYHLVYLFLSNRVHPSATPNKLAIMNIRTDIQSLIYKSLMKSRD